MKKLISLIREFFRGSSLKIRFLGIIVCGSLLLSISLIEYSFQTAKAKLIQQVENQVKNTALNGWKEVSLGFESVKTGQRSIEEVREELSLRLSGPLKSILISFPDTVSPEEESKHIFQILKLPWKISQIPGSEKEPSFLLNLPGGKTYPLPVKIVVNHQRRIVISADSPELVRSFYESFKKISSKERDLLTQKFGLRIIRDTNGITNKIGSDGYIWATGAIFPEWLIRDTVYPDDYTPEEIGKRFKTNFSGLSLPFPVRDYMEKFGNTPEKQIEYIQDYMRKDHSEPLPVYDYFHPSLGYVNTDNISNHEGEKVGREIGVRHNGIYYYSWKNPTDVKPRKKIVYMKLFEFDHGQEKIRWVICAGAYEDEAYLPIISLRHELFLISFLITGFFISLTLFFFYHYLNNPLGILLSAVRKVNSGDLNVKVPVQNRDEIGFLSESFNRMVDSLMDSRKRLEEYANSLEDKVEERTRELKTSLEKIQKLKFFQDADYYLTSLLLAPLGTNLAKSFEVKIDFFVKQKNEFVFKGAGCSLGGDLCITRDLKLQGKEYTVFLNADAMGKSMQGAGGALVLGSVFEQIICRFQNSRSLTESYYPEKWLKNAFIDLHKVFESFDGAMYVTLVMGIIDNYYGTMYFMNAEHPAPVLFRDKNASYLPSKVRLKKLGDSHFVNNSPSLQVVELKPHDVVIIGSDGKDDIWLTDENSSNRMNDDENLFLEIVKETGADLPEIYQKISTIGKISDDFSLLKITYVGSKKNLNAESHQLLMEDFVWKNRDVFFPWNNSTQIQAMEELVKKFPDDKSIRHELVRLELENRDYKQCARRAKEFFYEFPGEYMFAFFAAYCLFLEGDYDEASQFSERVKIREPFFIDNLFLLTSIYLKKSENFSAEKQIRHILMVEPNNQKALKIKEALMHNVDIQFDFQLEKNR